MLYIYLIYRIVFHQNFNTGKILLLLFLQLEEGACQMQNGL